MADPSLYTYPSPLEGYEGLEPLPNERAEDGKSLVNPPAKKRSEAYSSFVSPITNSSRGGFDVHIYFLSGDKEETQFAHELWERIRREFPELRIYNVWDKPIGPHPLAMFEVNLFTPGRSRLAIWTILADRLENNLALLFPGSSSIGDPCQRSSTPIRMKRGETIRKGRRGWAIHSR